MKIPCLAEGVRHGDKFILSWKTSRFLPLFLVVLAVSGERARAQALDPLVKDGFDWEMTAEVFDQTWIPQHFEWVSEAKNSARHAGRYGVIDPKTKEMVAKTPTIGALPVGETIVRFKDGVLRRIDVSVFNRADDRPLQEDGFQEAVEAAKALVTRITGNTGTDEGKDNRSATRSYATHWTGKTSDYTLEFSFQRAIRNRQPYLAEFIRLRVEPTSRNQSLLDKVASREGKGPKNQEALQKEVTKKPNGDVVIGSVPMVDQGERGYCAVASAERVFRYYGLDVDQHAMAQLAGSSAGGGTNPDAMVEALQNAAGRLKVHVRTHEGIEDYDSFEKMVKDYNREAKKNKAREIPIRSGYYLSMMGCYQAFDVESLRAARMKGNAYERFRKLMREEIGEGVPILWSLFLGLYPEPDIPQRSGGHMRLIIGYNDKTEEVIYSDSWGAGHEMKRMKMEEAYTMTTGLRTLQPFR